MTAHGAARGAIRDNPTDGFTGQDVPKMMVDGPERSRAESAARASEGKLRAFIDAAPVAIAMFDTAMCYLAVSRRFVADYRLKVATQAELIGRSHYDLFPEIPERWRAIHRRVLAGETLSSEAEAFARADGLTDWIRWEMVPWRLDDGGVGGALLFTEDVTHRKQAEVALAASEERLRRIVEAIPNALVMVDADGIIEMVNARTEHLFGHARSELLGQSVELLLPENVRAHHPQRRAEYLSAPVSRPMGAGAMLFGRKKDGGKFEVEVGLSPLETGDGLKVISAIVDISQRVKLEARLRQSYKMEAVGRLTAGVAHDFNNLLQALGGSLELIQDELVDRPAALEYARVADRAVRHGGELTSRLLSFSRQQLLNSSPVLMEKLFRDITGLLGHLFEGNTEIVMQPGPPGLAALIDPAQAEAAIVNLATNARDAMPLGGQFRVSAVAADADPALALAPGRYTVIVVTDTGAGMDEDTLAKACDPFFSTKGLKGSGLGLSMVQGFARQSGGDLRIASAPGQGTTIELWLPAARVATPPPPPPRDSVLEQARGRVMLVDDSPEVLLTVGAVLRQAGFEVTRVESGDLALARLLSGERFDAIVTDFAMPGLNGLELLARARAIEPGIAGLIITGFSDPDMLDGMNNVTILHKPFSRVDLVGQINRLIGAARETSMA